MPHLLNISPRGPCPVIFRLMFTFAGFSQQSYARQEVKGAMALRQFSSPSGEISTLSYLNKTFDDSLGELKTSRSQVIPARLLES